MLRRLNKNCAAFTLLETTFAVAIFGIAMIAGMLLMTMSVRRVRAYREIAYVARDLETTMENVRNLSWAELTAQPSSQNFDATKPLVALFGKQVNPAASTEDAFQGSVFSPTGTIRIEEVTGVTDLRKVTVKIEHVSASTGQKISNSLVTLISKNGIDRR